MLPSLPSNLALWSGTSFHGLIVASPEHAFPFFFFGTPQKVHRLHGSSAERPELLLRAAVKPFRTGLSLKGEPPSFGLLGSSWEVQEI